MSTSTGLLRRPAPARAPRALRGPAPATSTWLAANWQRLALPTMLLVTAVAYLWDLSASGNANTFYAAAVQAGTKSWKAFFFGSLDSSSFITVDKPPASLWVMALSGRIFGFSSWSMLAPQALEGVAAVALLYAAVRRWFGTGAGLAAGALLAATPVAALMFRFNNPDALLVLMLVAAAYCLTRALERAGTRWVVAAGTMIGFAFLAKMMQAFLVLPGFALVYLVAAPTGLRRRVLQTLAGGVAILVSAGWWVAIVALWPASSRPMIDGSFDNSILNLITGYNGLGRIFGASGPGGGGGGNFSGTTGVLRLFNSVMGGQASWLLPAALLALVVGLVATRRAPRTDRTRAALLLWGGWLIVSGLVFSLSSGIIHSYYTVALAPAIAALAAIGGRMLWARRASARSRLAAAAAVAVSAGWAWDLLDRTPSWEPGSQSAASLELATGGAPVMAIGGFDNEGRNLTLTQFEHYVKGGEIHYYIASEGGGPGGGGPGGGGNSSGAITTWVKAHYKAVTVGGQTLYELTSPVS
jgi:4-amino-4-deoxy-L-arabinose transferase-like glycosyltransferase